MHGTYKYEFTMHFGLVTNNNLDANDKSLYGGASKAPPPRGIRVKKGRNFIINIPHVHVPFYEGMCQKPKLAQSNLALLSFNQRGDK